MQKITEHDQLKGTALFMQTHDTLNWSHEDHPWRLRFEVAKSPEEDFTDALFRLQRWVQKQANRLVKGNWMPGSSGLYVQNDADAARLFRVLRNRDLERDGYKIRSIQHKSSYDAAVAASYKLADTVQDNACSSPTAPPL